MKIVVVLGHPNKASFNHAIAETAVKALQSNKHEVVFHDLYAEGFDPILTQEEFSAEEVDDPVIKSHCEQVTAADALVIVHPNWWGQPPAIVKGWVDRVLRYGVAYTFREQDGEEVVIGLLKGRTALVVNTCMTTEAMDSTHYHDPLDGLWRNSVLGFCGVEDIRRLNLRMVQAISQDERKGMLEEVVKTTDALFPVGA
jgi:putative NADPH-quinone reductase